MTNSTGLHRNQLKALVHQTEVSIRFSEVDALGIVWHGHYIKYMEDGREAFGIQYGISYLDVQKAGYTVPLVKVHCEYKRPLKYSEKAIVETTYHVTAAAKMMFTYKIFRADDGMLMAEGESVQVFLDSAGTLCINNPAFYEAWKQKHIPSINETSS